MSTSLKPLFIFFLRPIEIFRNYSFNLFRLDLIAGLTVAVILLPQAIAYALIIELPPEMGLYSAIIGAIVGALWGSSMQMHTGPTNALSLLGLSVLLSVGIFPDSPEFLTAIALIAVMVGVFQVVMGLARLGILVNFVSDSVIVGFTGGAGVLIMVNQLRHLFGLNFASSPELIETLHHVFQHIVAQETHWPSLIVGGITMVLIALLKRFVPKWPGLLISMIIASMLVASLGVFGINESGIKVIGELPRNLPPLTLPVIDLDLISRLSTGALAVAAIGLVEAMSIARSLASQTGQRLNSNQEFIGQGLANIASGFFSGFAGSGSFARSAVNFGAGARTPLASIFSAIFVFLAMFLFAPLAAYIPRTALSGALILTGYGMIDRHEMVRIWRGTRGDTVIMMATLLGTLFLELEFAVLVGILISLVRYIMKTSVPKVFSVLPDDDYNHLIPRSDKPSCPQLGIMDILGDLYFGAVSHVEQAIRQNLSLHPEQRFLLLRMRGVHHCDISGIHMLESIMRAYREQGGDLYLMRVHEGVRGFMEATGFDIQLGKDHFLPDDESVNYLFQRILDPAICIYECEVRAFYECQNLPKRTYSQHMTLPTDISAQTIDQISPEALWKQSRQNTFEAMIIDVREQREFDQGHVPTARLKPLSTLATDRVDISPDVEIILVCRSGRRSLRAAHFLRNKGFNKVKVLQGGMLAWEAAGLLEAVEETFAEELL